MATLGGTSASGETLTGTSGDDVIFNGVVDDRTTDGGVDTIDGGGGNDIAVLVYTGQSTNIAINISNPASPTTNLGTLTSIETLHFYGGSGNDVITTGAGADQLNGGLGDDILNAGDGNDLLSGGAGNDIFNGGAGNDTVTFENATGSIGVDLRVAGPQDTGEGNDSFSGIENLLGGRYSDNLNGDAGDNSISDKLFGDDTLRGGDGADHIVVERDYSISSAASSVVLDGGAGNDVLEFNGDPHYFGSEAAGARYFDLAVFDAGEGDDQIFIHALGGAVVTAGGGSDTVTMDVSSKAGGYRDISLGAGADFLKISAPSDPTLAAASIVVRDFAAGDVNSLVNPGDTLDMRAYLNAWLTGYTANADPFATGHVRLLENGADTLVQIDRNGGGDSFSTFITLQNVKIAQLTEGNFTGFGTSVFTGDTLNGGTGPDTFVGGAKNDTLNGGDGNDKLTGGGGSDKLNGGNGYDTAIYLGSSHSYTIAVGGGKVTGGPEGGTDTLTGVERLQFVDGYFSTETSQSDTAASVYRLYQTMLNRAPDSAGLASWVQAIDQKGVALKAVANGFIDSAEFKGTYGALSNDAFVELMYTNVLHRASDAQGKATWVGQLNAGGTRADVAIGFSQSGEFVNNMASTIQKGVWVGDMNAKIAARFYDTVFGRLPDAGGLDTWTKALNSGQSLSTVANGFVASNEFKTTYGNLNNDAFVELMYHNVLGRASDASGKATWLNTLNAGGTRADVVVGFSESAEHIRLTAPHIDDGVWTV